MEFQQIIDAINRRSKRRGSRYRISIAHPITADTLTRHQATNIAYDWFVDCCAVLASADLIPRRATTNLTHTQIVYDCTLRLDGDGAAMDLLDDLRHAFCDETTVLVDPLDAL